MPCPISLVVKNGSNAFALTSWRHADAGIGHGNHDVLTRQHLRLSRSIEFVEIDVCGLDRQLSSVRHGVPRVDGKIDDRHFELIGVGKRAPEAAGENCLDRDLLPKRTSKEIRHARNKPSYIDGGRVQAAAAARMRAIVG